MTNTNKFIEIKILLKNQSFSCCCRIIYQSNEDYLELKSFWATSAVDRYADSKKFCSWFKLLRLESNSLTVLPQGDLSDEQEVFQWILIQKNDESIEDVDRETFLEYIDSKDFLAVVFCKHLKIVKAFEIKTFF